MSDFETFTPGLVRRVVGVDHLVAAFCVGSTAAWGASALDHGFLLYYWVLLNSGLANQVLASLRQIQKFLTEFTKKVYGTICHLFLKGKLGIST